MDGVVYLVDVADPTRIAESKVELDGALCVFVHFCPYFVCTRRLIVWTGLLADPDLAQTPFVILGNKIDADGALSEPQVRDMLGLHQTTGKGTVAVPENMRPIEVFMCSIVNREGYGPGFQWLSQYIK